MRFNEYQAEARTTAIYPEDRAVEYLSMGLAGEVGEVLNKLKKVVRDGREIDPRDLTAELGDVLWYLSNLAGTFEIDLEDVAEYNIIKLRSRQQRGALGGSGDKR